MTDLEGAVREREGSSKDRTAQRSLNWQPHDVLQLLGHNPEALRGAALGPSSQIL